MRMLVIRSVGYLQPGSRLFSPRIVPFSQQEATIEVLIGVYKSSAYDRGWADQVTRMRRVQLQSRPLGCRWLSSSVLPEGWEAVTRKNGAVTA